MELSAREGIIIALIGVVGLCGLGLSEAIPRWLEPVQEKPVSVAPAEIDDTASGRWIKIRGRASEHDIGTVVTIGGRPSADGNFVFRLRENRAIVVCSNRERRPDPPASVETFKGLLVRLDDPIVENLSGGWACLETHAPGDSTANTAYVLDGYEPTSKGMRLAFVVGLALAGVGASFALHRVWRSGRA